MPTDTTIRLGFFLGVFLLVAVWELLAPRRHGLPKRWQRWPSNLGLVAFNTLLVRLLVPTTAVAMALLAEAHGWGLLGLLNLPIWIAVALSIVLLDLTIYFQHVLLHAVPALWRVHRVHHADLVFDVTTGVRFHPLEILLSMAIKIAVIALLGPPAVAVLVFEVLLNATSMFNHGNISIPTAIDHRLRWLVVTPDMHRVHHSIVASETNSNFGFNVPWWDRLFGTYRDQPHAGHDMMTIGIEQFRNPAEQRVDHMLSQPFRGAAEGYSINRRQGDKAGP